MSESEFSFLRRGGEASESSCLAFRRGGEASESEFCLLLGGEASESCLLLGGEASESCLLLGGEASESCLLLGGEASESCLLLGGEASESCLLLGGEASESCLCLLGGESSESCLRFRGGDSSESGLRLLGGETPSVFISRSGFSFLIFLFFFGYKKSDLISSSLRGSGLISSCSSLITSLMRFFCAMFSPRKVFHLPDFSNSSLTCISMSRSSCTEAIAGSSSTSSTSDNTMPVSSSSVLGKAISLSMILTLGNAFTATLCFVFFFFFFLSFVSSFPAPDRYLFRYSSLESEVTLILLLWKIIKFRNVNDNSKLSQYMSGIHILINTVIMSIYKNCLHMKTEVGISKCEGSPK